MPRPTLRVVPIAPAPLSAQDIWDLHWECRMKAAFLEGNGQEAEAAKWRALGDRVLASREQLTKR